MRFETCRRRQKLKNLIKGKFEKCTFRWFMLHNYITMHGAKRIKKSKSYMRLSLQFVLLGTYLAGHEMNFYWILNFRLILIVRVLTSVIVV